MKKSLLALAALTAFGGAAYAQSSVTLFGVVDLAARNVKNERASGSVSQKSLSSGALNTSRLGFRGVEDLGGGLRAGFWIEGQIDPDNGTAGGQTWQRRSTVSLMGGFGELRLGRDYVPDFWNQTVYDPFGTVGVGSTRNIWAIAPGVGTDVRANNTVGYFLPALGGLFGQLMVAAGENAAPANKHVAGRLGWAGGPVNVAVAFGQTEVTPATDWERMNIGGSFRFGPATLMAQYGTGELGTYEITHWLIGGTMGFGASTLKLSYTKSEGDNAIATQDASQVALGYQYDLSKRTALYANYASISNKGTATYSVANAAGGSPGAPAGGRKSTGYEFGVRHSF